MNIKIEYIGTIKDRDGTVRSYGYHGEVPYASAWVSSEYPPSMFSILSDEEKRNSQIYKSLKAKLEKKLKRKPPAYVEPLVLVPEGEEPPSFLESLGIEPAITG